MENASNLVRLFVQGEGLSGIEHLEVPAESTFAGLKALIIGRLGLDAALLLFLEDQDDPPDDRAELRLHSDRGGIKVHLHRCRRVGVAVTFNGKHVEHSFGPSATVARVKRWAAEKFGMSAEDATEHVLQLAGTHTRPSAGAHLGTLASCPDCRVKFDLVPDERVNGSPEDGG